MSNITSSFVNLRQLSIRIGACPDSTLFLENVLHASDLVSYVTPGPIELVVHINFWFNFEMDVFYPRPEYSRLETALVEKMDKGLREVALVIPACNAVRQLWETRLALVFPAIYARISTRMGCLGQSNSARIILSISMIILRV